MIEQYLKVLMLKKHPENLKDYNSFCKFEIEQSCCSQEYPQQFIELYNNRKHAPAKSKVDYLHYGWLDSIEDYHPQFTNPYSIYGILNYLKDYADAEEYKILNHIEILYKMCHSYTHGSAVHIRYPLLQYFEISKMLYYVVTDVFRDIHNTLGIDYVPEDKTLIDILNRNFAILQEQYSIRSKENFELYYSYKH